jgi:thermitase
MIPVSAAHAQRIVVGFDTGTSVAQRAAALRAAGAGAHVDLGRVNAKVIVVPDAAAAKVRAALAKQSAVRYSEPDAMLHASWTPNDTNLGSQWALTAVGARTAWDASRGASVLVADVDTGVDSTHPDLAGKITAGWDFVAGDANPSDENGHGTHVAGIIAANTNNGAGVAGMAPSAQVLAIRVLDANGSGYQSNIAQGVTYAVDHGAKVINLSLGGSSGTTALSDAIKYAAGKGVVVTCASGNNGSTSSISYPARYDGCVAVGATDSSDRIASFSNRGTGLDVSAPGVSILSTVRGGRYEYWSGTSMATPMVSGLAALLAAQGLDRSQIIARMESTAKDLGAAGYDTTFGYGRIDAAAALSGTGTTTPPPPPPVTTTPPPVTQPTNHAPTCTAASYAMRGGHSYRITMRCKDADGDKLTYAISSLPSVGKLTRLNTGAGTVTYTSPSRTRGVDAFMFTAKDPSGASATPATVTITLT